MSAGVDGIEVAEAVGRAMLGVEQSDEYRLAMQAPQIDPKLKLAPSKTGRCSLVCRSYPR